MTNDRKHPKRTLQMYKSYSFKDKDPIIDQCRTIVQDEGESYGKIHDMSGISTSTLYNWFNGETKRPQFATVMALVRCLGYDMQLTRVGPNDAPKKRATFKKNIRREPRSAASP